MGKSAQSILRKFRKEKKLTFEDIKELYQDRAVKEVDFVSDGKALLITQVRLKNGDTLSFN